MLKTIAEPSLELADFIDALKLPLSEPQHRHITQIANGLVTTQGSKTLSTLYHHIVEKCPVPQSFCPNAVQWFRRYQRPTADRWDKTC